MITANETVKIRMFARVRRTLRRTLSSEGRGSGPRAI
jgi:hypothetical protein